MQKTARFDQLSGRLSVSAKGSVFMRVAYAITALACWIGLVGTLPAWAQAEPARITPNLARQLEAVMEEKKSRTPAQQKIDTALLMAMKRQRGEVTPFVSREVEVAGEGRVVVDINCPATADMADAIEAMGGTVLNRYPRYDMIRAHIPLAQLEILASKSVVRSVRQPIPWMTRQGRTLTEGDAAHRADEARTTFGLDGAGVKICVLSDGIDDLAVRQTAGELPTDVEVLDGQEGFGSEGTALLEIIHDIAGGAVLGYATALPSPAQYATNIRDLRHVLGCDILVDDVGFLNQSPFQAGIISQAVQDVVADGAVYFTAAGNDGAKESGTSGTFEGDFTDSGADFEDLFPDVSSLFGSLHGFPTDNGPNIGNEILSPGFGVALHWTDPLGGSANDYDLCLADLALTTLLNCSAATQNGDDDPFEFIASAPSLSQLLILNFNDEAEGRFLHLQAFGGILEASTNGSIFGHPGTDEAIAVGAADVSQARGGAFDGTDMVERFSSDGPRRVFFDADGAPFTPGNFSSIGGLLRQKPDVTAADGVATTTSGFETFFGTSAAAPHAAGVAALLKQADPTLTPREVEDLLEATATDIEATGFDDISGFGLINALDAVEALAGMEELINDALRLDHLGTFFDPGDTRAPAGVLTIDVTFTNISENNFEDVFFKVVALTGGNQLLNADGGPGGVGSELSVPEDIDAGDTFDVMFEIGLQEANPLRFLLDVFGTSQ